MSKDMPHGPHSLGGFQGKGGKGRRGDHRGKSSASATGPTIGIAYALLFIPAVVVLLVGGFIAHGYGLF